MLNKFTLSLLVLFLSAGTASAGDIRVCFTPGDECTDVVVDTIREAKKEVLLQAYSFTSPPIVKALVDAKKRGVDVRVVLDRSNICKKADCENKGQIAADTLRIAKVPVLVDDAHAIAHNKVVVLDGATVITGSFNFTKAAQERNAENLLVIRDPNLARRYRANWQSHADHSDRYEGR
jgi:phosphatidylserine/phosphatidylglycerophosphate/cardiolipin synthase-like enzyme